jgi:GAF domain-containing protein
MEVKISRIPYQDKTKFYAELLSEVEGILESDWLINMANFSALLKQHLPETNWIGFYLNRKNELLLGPFQGLPACTRIAFGKGVCGTAAQQKKSLMVPDVNQFSGHIACDSASRSEIVIPLMNDQQQVLGVLDIDSPQVSRFDEADLTGLEKAAALFMQKTIWPSTDL